MSELAKSCVLSGSVLDGQHELMVRVYFEDTDFTGIVYHARYLHFFERGRSDFLRLCGIDHSALSAGIFGEPLSFVVKGMVLDFQATARIDDVLSVKTRIDEKRGARLMMSQTIRRGDIVVAHADVSVVLINQKGQPRRLPIALLTRLV